MLWGEAWSAHPGGEALPWTALRPAAGPGNPRIAWPTASSFSDDICASSPPVRGARREHITASHSDAIQGSRRRRSRDGSSFLSVEASLKGTAPVPGGSSDQRLVVSPSAPSIVRDDSGLRRRGAAFPSERPAPIARPRWRLGDGFRDATSFADVSGKARVFATDPEISQYYQKLRDEFVPRKNLEPTSREQCGRIFRLSACFSCEPVPAFRGSQI